MRLIVLGGKDDASRLGGEHELVDRFPPDLGEGHRTNARRFHMISAMTDASSK